MKQFTIIFISLLVFQGFHNFSLSQRAPGTWKAYTSFYHPVGIVKKDSAIFCLTEGGMFTHNYFSGVQATYTTVNGLSGLNMTTIYHDPGTGIIFIGYGDGTIDYFSDPSRIRPITDIYRSTTFTAKKIWKLRGRDSLIYIATDFGIVVYDPILKETRSAYTKIGDLNSGTAVVSLEIWNDSLYAAVGNFGLYSAPFSHNNLADPSAWTKVNNADSVFSGNCRHVAAAGGKLFAVIGDSVIMKDPGGDWGASPFTKRYQHYFDSQNDIVISATDNITEIYYPVQDSLLRIDNEGDQECAMAHDDIIWVGDKRAGLYSYYGGGFKRQSPTGPLTSASYRVVAGPGELYIAPSGRDGSTQSYDVSGFFYYGQETGWKNFFIGGGTLDSNIYRGFSHGYYDSQTGRAYMGSNGQGVMVMEHGDTVKSYTGRNSPLVGFTPNDIRISGLTMDSEGGLWVTTILTPAERLLNYLSPEGTWYNFQVPGGRPIAIGADEYNNKWIINESGGIQVFSENLTPGDISDDKRRTLNTTINNGALPTNEVHSIARDKKGLMWAGTGDGVTVFYDPFGVFSNSFPDASCPVYENQCLLKFQKVKDICVDGANQKWLATEQGAFLMNPDGTKLIHHFTIENSPLFSDNINDISIDPVSGEVYFATDRGVISFMGEATEGFEDASDLYAYPNPVLPDFDGDIIIRGLVAESKVRITNASGHVVKEIESLGGQVTWDGKDTWGNRVKSGVYIVLASDADGKGAGAAKIAVIGK